MKNLRYDEYQLKNRHQLAFQTLILIFVLVMTNGLLKESYGVWAPPLLEALILIFIPGMYFAIMSIAKNAYFRKKDYPILVIILFGLAAVLGLFSFVPAILNGTFIFVENGQLTNQVGSLFIPILFGGMVIAIIVRKMINKREDAMED